MNPNTAKTISEVLDFIACVLMAAFGIIIWSTIEFNPESPAYRQYALGAGRVVLLLAAMGTTDYIIRQMEPTKK